MLTKAPEALEIANHIYPDCKKGAVNIEVSTPDTQHNCASYWDGGSRNYYTLYCFATRKSVTFPAQSAFDRRVEGIDRVKLDKGVALVERSYFCGKDCGVTIHIRQDDMSPAFLPTPAPELSEAEVKCLFYTRSKKSSYAGDNQYRRHAAGMSVEQWEAAKVSLASKGLMNKAGALTMEGKNVAVGLRL